MQIVIDVDDALAKVVLEAVQAETRSGLAETDLSAWLADWLQEVAKRATVHVAENEAAGKAAAEYEAKQGGKIAVRK